MPISEYLGYISAFFTTVAFVPQVWLIYKTRDTTSISLPTFLIFTLGLIGWGFYGILIQSLPVILANGITIVLAGYILFMKLTEKARSTRHGGQ